MVGDRESQLYRDVADLVEQVPKLQKIVDSLKEKVNDVESLEKDVRALKTRLSKLAGRVETSELLGFQDQINRLNDKIDGLRNDFNDLSGENFMWMQRKLAEFIIASTLTQTNHLLIPQKRKDALEQLNISAASAHTKVEMSDTPLQVAIQFYNDCMDLAGESGLRCIKLDYP